MNPAELDRLIGAVLVPAVRVPGTFETPTGPHPGCALSDEHLTRFPPAALVAFGRTPGGPVSPAGLLLDVERRCEALGLEPPLVACDLEEGAGLHFPEGTRMPPALALAAAARGHGDTGHGLNWIRSAAYVTALEARSLGVDLVLAPVADVNTRPSNPIVSVRGFGDRPEEVARRASAFCEGLQAGGAGACAKHFPGHGDTDRDSHLELPRVDADLALLRARELVPFRALFEAGVDAVMVGHLDVPGVTAVGGGEAGVAASLSRPLVTGLLRGELDYGGPVLTDALDMGALADVGDARYALALQAGCDGLLCPSDPLEAAGLLRRAVRLGDLDVERLAEAAGRMRALRRRLIERRAAPRGTLLHPDVRGTTLAGHADFARTVAERSLCVSGTDADWAGIERFDVRPAFPEDAAAGPLEGLWREVAPRPPGPGPGPGGGPAREAPAGTSVGAPAGPTPGAGGAPLEAALGVALAVTFEVRAGSGRHGLSPERLSALERRIDGLVSEGVRVALLWFATPQALPAGWWEPGRPLGPGAEAGGGGRRLPVLVAFAPSEPMVRAARRFLEGHAAATGSLPVRAG